MPGVELDRDLVPRPAEHETVVVAAQQVRHVPGARQPTLPARDGYRLGVCVIVFDWPTIPGHDLSHEAAVRQSRPLHLEAGNSQTAVGANRHGQVNLVPVDLQVCANPQPARRRSGQAAHLGRHHPRQPRREADLAERLPPAVGPELLQHGCHHRHARLLGRVDRLRGGVFGPAGQHEVQVVIRTKTCEPAAEIQLHEVFLGKPRPRSMREPVHRLAVARAQDSGHVAAPVVHGLDRENALSKSQQVLTRRRSRAGEPLVREHHRVGRVVDHVEPQVVEVEHLVHRLGDFDDVAAVTRHEPAGLDLDRLLRPRRARRSVRRQLTHRPRAEEVGDEHKPRPVPCEQDRARGALAVQLGEAHDVAGGFVEFRLGDAVRPADTNDIGRPGPSQAEFQRLPRLAQPRGQRRVLDRGVQRAGVCGDARADAVRVGPQARTLVTPAGEFQAERAVAVAQVPPGL